MLAAESETIGARLEASSLPSSTPHWSNEFDVPNSAFGEHFVLVKGDETPEHARVETAIKERARRTAAGKALVRRESNRFGLARALVAGYRLGLLGGAAAHQGLALGEAIGDQKIVMMPVGVGRRRRDEQVERNDLRALMDELEEGVLAVGARLAPHHRAGRRIGRRAVELDVLAVALHLQLLEIGGEAPEPLVVRDHSVRGVAEDVAVPDAEQPHQDRDVVLDRRFAEVLVDLVAAAEKVVEAVRPDRDRERQPDA